MPIHLDLCKAQWFLDGIGHLDGFANNVVGRQIKAEDDTIWYRVSWSKPGLHDGSRAIQNVHSEIVQSVVAAVRPAVDYDLLDLVVRRLQVHPPPAGYTFSSMSHGPANRPFLVGTAIDGEP